MCGFCGVLLGPHSTQTVDPSLLKRMNGTLIHRGPDAQNYYTEPKLGLGHCRLSIIDLAGGSQPMQSAEGHQILAFNGEIYNFQLLREKLIAQGRHFKTQSDTEVILHLYAQYGIECLSHLRGMFSFALWDGEKKQLLLARDRLGKKPLVYAHLPNEGIVFASELKALLEHPDVSRDIDREAIHLYLTYQYIPSPHTIFKAIRKLPPASYALWRDGALTIKPYWTLSHQKKTDLPLEEAGDQLMAKLKEAVKLRMIADVPLGAFLSGGIDSSLIVGLMSEMSAQPVKTYSIGFEDLDISELGAAKTVAQRFGCDHHEFIVKPDTAELLPRLAWHYGEPFADPSALPSYIVARETRKHVTVALNGDGGDENFAGYYRYAAMALLQNWGKLPSGLRHLVALTASRGSSSGTSNSWIGKACQVLALGDQSLDESYLQLVNVFKEDEKRTLYSPQMRQETAALDARLYLFNRLHSLEAGTGLDQYMNADFHTYLPECLMTKMDIATMATSLETRSPLLDHEFVEMAAQLPAGWKWKPILRTKWILRHRLKNWLPDEILGRKKQGFGLPLEAWFRGELKSFLENILLSPQALKRGYFDPAVIRRMLEQHQKGEKDYGHRLWSLLMLEMWHLVYVDKTYTFP